MKKHSRNQAIAALAASAMIASCSPKSGDSDEDAVPLKAACKFGSASSTKVDIESSQTQKLSCEVTKGEVKEDIKIAVSVSYPHHLIKLKTNLKPQSVKPGKYELSLSKDVFEKPIDFQIVGLGKGSGEIKLTLNTLQANLKHRVQVNVAPPKKLNTTNRGTPVRHTGITLPSANSSMVAKGGDLYLLGGADGSNPTNAVYQSKNGGQSWKELDDVKKPFTARRYHRAVVYKDHIFVIAGSNVIKGKVRTTLKHNDVWKSADGKTWTKVKADNNTGFTERGSFGAVVYRDHIFVIGGGGAKSNDVWKSADGATWTKVKDNNDKGFSKSGEIIGVVHNGEIVISLYDSGTAQTQVWSSSNGKDWQKLYGERNDNLSKPSSLVSLGGHLWAIGSADSDDHDRFVTSIDGKTWTKRTTGYSLKNEVSAAVLGNKIIVSNDAHTWIYSPF